MKPGMLVKHRWTNIGLGITLGWFCKDRGYVDVLWEKGELPCHISKLTVINEV